MSLAFAGLQRPDASGLPAEPPAAYALVALVPPRKPTADEAVRLKVTVGPLRDDLDVTIADAAGNVIGGISPFGSRARSLPGSSMLSLPTAANDGEPITLRVWVENATDGARRVPTKDELLSIELVYVRTQ